MNKQDKTFWTLTLLDKLYIPRIESIQELEVFQIFKHGHGLRIKYYYENWIDIDNPSRTTFGNICCNKQKAIELQKEMVLKQLDLLTNKNNEAFEALSKFTKKHFTPK